ncbi:GIY-YIG nuclease family protein [Candidatus Chrysopegis kryptomonas]|uniref:Putative endonuclease n=1 Tax=Candidatus Chryseopegocella kryptomonas TaxID=1633643 RepID=A0A0P1NZR8_9BACT|nr:GIY-YIG nuclease family protein [Candidatus Chrysopegis kryptomonas]CUT04545.1 putative endonuclease [Candidatus Chrysopegis kryptomonas]
MPYFVYILKSLKDSGYYIGHTKNVERRLREHNLGRVKSTKCRRPFKLIYTEKFETKKEAFAKEMYLKSPEGYFEKLEIVKKFGA